MEETERAGDPSRAELAEKVERLLRELGGTADEVRDSLIAKGVKGRVGDNRECPIARYLRRGADENLRVSRSAVWFGGKTLLTLPDHVFRFVNEFDLLGHPTLLDRS